LPIIDESPISLSSENLEIFLKQTVKIEEFDGVVEIFLDDLKYDQDIHFAINQYEDIEQDIAFSAASTIKIPIMLSVFRRLEEPTSETVLFLMNRMISYSENDPADALMKNYIDPNSGPLIISSDLQLLGYENTFLAGFFALGSPVLKIDQTPANTRTDIFLDPDIYNQVTPAEIGDLLKEIYYCSNNNGESSIINTFTNEVTASECQQMVEFLKENKIGSLIEAGLPPEASIAHKHGWTTELDGLLHSMSDVGIVFSPSGDYILTIFIYTGDQLIFDEGNYLFAKLSQIIYNALNINSQEYWWID
jgi:beta-lactamase class A